MYDVTNVIHSEELCSEFIKIFLYNQENKEEGKDIFNMQLKFYPYTQMIINWSQGGKNGHFIQQACTDQLSEPLRKSQLQKKKKGWNWICLYVSVCVGIQPNTGNINKITSLWLSWPARMHLGNCSMTSKGSGS